MIIQGREITSEDIALIREMISSHPSWGRTRISKELSALWRWRADNGQLKDMACRSLLLKLEKRGYISLPAKKSPFGGNKGGKKSFPYVPHSTSLIRGKLKSIAPVNIELVKDKEHLRLFKYLLSRYHYLGFGGIVGENLKYLVFDQKRRPLACLLFGLSSLEDSPSGQLYWLGCSYQRKEPSVFN